GALATSIQRYTVNVLGQRISCCATLLVSQSPTSKVLDVMGAFSALFLAVTILAVPSLTSCHQIPTAKTSNGTYTGRHVAEFNQDFFLGIPYASAPPLDNPKHLTESWNGARPATAYGLSCYTASSARSLAHVDVT